MQFDFPGALSVPDGRYLARERGSGRESVLVLETVATAPAAAPRRRRRPREAAPEPEAAPVPLARATAIRAFAPFAADSEAERWLAQASEEEQACDALFDEGLALLNRALHVHGAAAGAPHAQQFSREQAAGTRIGYGSGEEVAAGRFSAARELGPGSAGKRRRRGDELRPQQRLAAVLGGRESLDACETLLPRARADLDGGRTREAALQLRVALEALLVELADALEDSGHRQDMATLRERRGEAGETANLALRGELGEGDLARVRELLEVCERVLRRRRVLEQ